MRRQKVLRTLRRKKRLHAKSRMFVQKDLEEQVIRKLAEGRGFLPPGLPCLAQLTEDAHEQVVFQHIAAYSGWLSPPFTDDEKIRGAQVLKQDDCPRSKYEALFDERPSFDAIRESFLVTEDPQRKHITSMLQEMVTRKSIPGNCEKKIASFIEELIAARSEWKSSVNVYLTLVRCTFA